MIRKEFRGDYLGFTYKDKHSSTLEIVRTSDGKRFNEALLSQPWHTSIKRQSVDGSLITSTNYNSKTFSISFAYDELEEEGIRGLQEWLNAKEPGYLILDERPYVKYWCHLSSPLSLSYVPFNSDKVAGGRLYKGEGNFDLTCYDFYGVNRLRELKNYNGKSIQKEWQEAAKLKESLTSPVSYDIFLAERCNLYNPGVIPSALTIPNFKVISQQGFQVFRYVYKGDILQTLVLDLSKLPLNVSLTLDGERKMIYETYDKSKVHSLAIVAGDFIEVKNDPLASQYLQMTPVNESSIQINQVNGFHVAYHYYYY